MRSEGIAERMGDILLSCTGGTAGTVVTGNLSIALPVPITNRLTPGTPSDLLVTVDTGTGPTPVPFTAQLLTPNTVGLNGISFTTPASRAVTIAIGNLRAAAMSAALQQPIQAFLILDRLSTLALQNNPVTVAVPLRSLLTNASSTVIRCVGSPVASTISLSALFAAGTHFESTRVTEGFPAAFQPKTALEDSGTRFLIRYTQLPAGLRLFVPDVVAGSDTLRPTAGGDLGRPQSGGAYVPGSGTLLLSRVANADANGAGGSPVYRPGPAGSPTVAFDSAGELSITNGSAYAVYEVMDQNPALQENAQFPTFIGLNAVNASSTSQESVSFGPVSTDLSANSTAPIPRFVAGTPPSDCQVVGDCNAAYFPALSVFAQPLQFSAFVGGAAMQPPGYIAVQNANANSSVLNWATTITYQSGSGWISLDGASGVNNGSVRVWIHPEKLAAGTYNATITIDAGPVAGTKVLPVTLVVSALPPVPVPSPQPPPPVVQPTPAPGIVAVTNAADFLPGPVVAGSLATIKGTRFTGKDIKVTFDGVPAKILFSNDTQINLQVPVEVASKASAQVVVTIDGVSSPAQTVPLAAAAPAIFSNGILNQDNTLNSPDNGAPVGSVIQVFLTGLASNTGTVLVQIHDREDLVPLFAGPAPGLTGVQQVNVTVPDDLPAMTTSVVICTLDPAGKKVCSAETRLTLQ